MMTLPSEPSISARELNRRAGEGDALEMLDVRTPGEYAAEHIAGAKLVPLDELDAAAYLRERGSVSRPIYVVCQSGSRARRAIGKFERAGFDGCVLVAGGVQAWIDAGLPVNRSENRVLPLMRQVQITVGVISAIGAGLALTVNPWFAVIPLVTGCGLLLAGATGFCGMALVLAKMPWNKSTSCGPKSCSAN